MTIQKPNQFRKLQSPTKAVDPALIFPLTELLVFSGWFNMGGAIYDIPSLERSGFLGVTVMSIFTLNNLFSRNKNRYESRRQSIRRVGLASLAFMGIYSGFSYLGVIPYKRHEMNLAAVEMTLRGPLLPVHNYDFVRDQHVMAPMPAPK